MPPLPLSSPGKPPPSPLPSWQLLSPPLLPKPSTHTGSTTANTMLATSSAAASKEAMPLPTRMVLAALAGMGAATVCHPLDVVRVQMQTAAPGTYRNTLDAGVQIFRNAGFSEGLYAGISAAYLRQWLYGSCRIGIYSYLLEKAQLEQQQKAAAGGTPAPISFAKKCAMGCFSGGTGSFVGTPSELALVRMSADSKLPPAERRNYKNVVDCIVRIYKEEGLTKLWRGATPTVARATVLSACQLGVTSEVKTTLIQSGYFGPGGQWLGGYPMMFCATLCSSFCANVMANPFDVMKSRMQNMAIDPVTGEGAYKNMVDCARKSIAKDGLVVMWAGFTPAFVKLAPYTVISLTLADKLTKALTGKDAL